MKRKWSDLALAIVKFAHGRVKPRLKIRIEALERGEEPRLPPDHLFDKVFGGFTEITNTYDVMLDIELYIRRFPFSGTRVRRSRYLQYHIEAYFHETYILRERLVNYAVALERLYRKTPRSQVALQASKRAQIIATGTLAQLTRIRGEHVHQRRFLDEKLTHLSGTELIIDNSDESDIDLEISRRYLAWEYNRARREWIQTIRMVNSTIAVLLDAYGNVLYPVLFDEEGQFIHPATLRPY